jgi:hypothetical protein
MHYMEDLKDLLCAELEDYAEKGKKSGKMSTADIQLIDTVLNSVKNIYKINKYEEDGGYSEDGHYMGEGRIYGTSYESGYSERGGSSYARGRGRYAKRDSMGRYSRDGGMSYRGGMRGGYSREDGKHYMMEELGRLMEDATPAEREALKKCMQALERA